MNDQELCQVLNVMTDSCDPLLEPLVKAAAEDEDYQTLLRALQTDVEFKLFENQPFVKDFGEEWQKLSIHKSGLIVYSKNAF